MNKSTLIKKEDLSKKYPESFEAWAEFIHDGVTYNVKSKRIPALKKHLDSLKPKVQ